MALKAVSIAGLILVIFAFGGARFLAADGHQSRSLPHLRRPVAVSHRARDGVRARIGHPHLDAASARRAPGARISPCFRWLFRSLPGPARWPRSCCGSGRCRLQHDSLLFLGLLGVVVLVLAIAFVLMWASGPMMRVMGVTGANVANRLLRRGAWRAGRAVRDGRSADRIRLDRQHRVPPSAAAEGQIAHAMSQARAALLEASRHALCGTVGEGAVRREILQRRAGATALPASAGHRVPSPWPVSARRGA